MLVGRASGDEYLLRLINDDQPDECDLLKQRFAVTNREAEVLLWVAKGRTNREIALILELSPRTANKHLEQLFKKMEWKTAHRLQLGPLESCNVSQLMLAFF